MIKHLEHSTDFDEFALLLKKWPILKELVRILAIPYQATIELQRRDLTLSDTYGVWITMELHLKSKQKRATRTGLETKLLSALEAQKEKHAIFTNPLMKAALFLDPRFRQQITRCSDDMEAAKTVLMSISRRLTLLSENQVADNMNQSTESMNSSGDSFDAQKEFDMYCKQTTDADVNRNVNSDIEAILGSFNPPPMSLNASVLAYWHSSYDKEYSLMLYDIATAVLAIAPTEVQIERDLSALKFILSDLRCRLSKQTLEDILTINLNKKLYLDVNESDVIELEKLYPPVKYN